MLLFLIGCITNTNPSDKILIEITGFDSSNKEICKTIEFTEAYQITSKTWLIKNSKNFGSDSIEIANIWCGHDLVSSYEFYSVINNNIFVYKYKNTPKTVAYTEEQIKNKQDSTLRLLGYDPKYVTEDMILNNPDLEFVKNARKYWTQGKIENNWKIIE